MLSACAAPPTIYNAEEESGAESEYDEDTQPGFILYTGVPKVCRLCAAVVLQGGWVSALRALGFCGL